MLKDYFVKDMTKNLVYEAFIENWVEVLRYCDVRQKYSFRYRYTLGSF